MPGLINELTDTTKAQLNQRIKMAWQILENESCPNCGVPVWLGHSTMPAIGFKVHRTTCQACATKAHVVKAHKSDDDEGETEYVTAVMYDGSDLPSRIDGHKTYDETLLNKGEFLPEDGGDES